MALSAQSSQLDAQDEAAQPRTPVDHFYRAYFFGPFRVMRGDQSLAESSWRRNKAKALLKWFLLNPGRMYSADQLIHLFWPDVARAAGLRNLHVAMNYLRHMLEPELQARQESTFIRRNKNNFYWFASDERWWSDILDIRHHYAIAKEALKRKDGAEAVRHYCIVARYCSRGFLPEDAYEDVFTPYRRQYDHLFIQILERLIHLCTRLNLRDELFFYAQQALQVNPYCEPAASVMITQCLQQGNISEAMRQLESFQRLLKDDLGIEPGEEIRALRQRISALLSTRAALAKQKR